MFAKIKKRTINFVKNNTGMKLAAIAISFAIWLVIVNYDNPTITRTFSNIPIEIINEETITSNEMIYSVPGNQTASVRVRCSRKLAESLKASDFKAVADFNDLYSVTNQIPVTITCTNSRVTSDEITPLTYSLSVELEQVETKTMEVQAVISGEPASGYLVGDVTCSPTTIQISAPTSFLDQISFAGVDVSVDGLSQTTNKNLPLQFYSAGGKPLDTSEVAFLSVSCQAIDVEVEILNVKSVNINCSVSGKDEVEDGYMYAGIEQNISSVQISGRKTLLAEVSALTIPSEELDITGASGNLVKSFDLRELLPEGVTLVDADNYMLTVTIRIEKLETREYTMNVGQVEFVNMEDDIYIGNTDSEFTVSVQGLSSDLNNLSTDEITVVIDMEDNGTGTFWLSPEIAVPRGFTVVNTPRILVRAEREEVDTTASTVAAEDDENESGTTAGDADPTETPGVEPEQEMQGTSESSEEEE